MRAVTDTDREAVRRGHKRATTVTLHQPGGPVGVLPVSAGEVSWSLSRGEGVRAGSVTVPGYGWFERVQPGALTWVTVDVGIEGSVWSFGEFPVLRAVAERPKGTVTLELGDWAWRAARPDAETALTIGQGGQPVAAVVAGWLQRTAFGGAMTVTRDDSGGAMCGSAVEVQLGGSVWAALTTLANQVGCVIVVTSRSTCELRNYRAGVPVDGLGGAIKSETVGIIADEAVNRVVVVGEQSNPGGATTVYRAERTLWNGPYGYSPSMFGGLALVQSVRQPVMSQAVVEAEAARLAERRFGVVRSQEVTCVPMPWLEVGDTVTWPAGFWPGILNGVIDTLTFPLTAGGDQRITLRDAVVTA